MNAATDFFRRDMNVKPRVGTIVAEFGNAADALHFSKAKGADYTVTAGINLVYAVRYMPPGYAS